MYQVIKMYGDYEPWWFLDGWEEDIVSKMNFTSYEEAMKVFQEECNRLSESFPMRRMEKGDMATFWHEDDQYWCEDCEEYLQRYHSIFVMASKELASDTVSLSQTLAKIDSSDIPAEIFRHSS